MRGRVVRDGTVIAASDPPDGARPADWQREAILKEDLLGIVERGRFADREPAEPCVLRDANAARWWARPIARSLLRREARALEAASGLVGVPKLLFARRGILVRTWIAGVAMQVGRPRDADYFRRALRLLVALHRRGVVHDDLAKEPNWLVTPDGRPSLVDFQLAWVSPRRGALFRLAAREDLRHLLKHKRTYRPDALTDRERRILATRSWPARTWNATGKSIYRFVTRRLLHWEDREGAGDRQVPLR